MPTHSEKRFLPYSPEQIFDLVVDIERYPEFLPWCVGARIRSRAENEIVADLMIGIKIIRERYTSRVKYERPGRIDVAYEHGGPFKHLTNRWILTAVEGGCEVDFFLDFEFRSRTLQRLIGLLFQEAVRRMVGAFESRAKRLYGAPPLSKPSLAPNS
ncbi:MAG: type II toxin-antitoxin system RatA family toxin [Alphaproteobacteria bacterium]|nr:type II toxin-antitoxin system RatA family toxin [Alphaproteobacteria bacterium]